MKVYLYCLLFSVAFLFIRCTRYNDRLEAILSFSGTNRENLEKVLVHYENDSLKYKAASFLIENMQGKGTIRYLFQGEDSLYIPQTPEADIITISADYLIENIDLAFEVWMRYPWCKHLSFTEFCRTILPYRVKQEPLDRWRSFYYNRYKDTADSLVQAGAKMKDVVFFMNTHYGKRYIQEADKIPGDFSIEQIEQLGGGTCDHLALNAVQVMRAIGIPLNIDILPYHGRVNGGHVYNSFIDEQGTFYYFSPYEREVERNLWIAPLVQRICFELKPESDFERNEWNGLLMSRILENVTEQYYKVCDLEINFCISDALVYLATFNRGRFNVVAQSKLVGGKASFQNISCELLYFPMVVQKRSLKLVNEPFILTEYGPEYIKSVERIIVVDGIKTYDAKRILKLGCEQYVLLYWKDGWQFIKEVVSQDSCTLNFGKIPVETLFLVRSNTKMGNMQRPFLMKDGTPVIY